MQMASSLFLFMKALTLLTLNLILALGLTSVAIADIGKTFDLKQKRAQLQLELDDLRKDTTASDKQIIEISSLIIALDQQIFDSYNETIDRVSTIRSNTDDNDKSLVWLALITTVISIFCAILLAMARGRVLRNGGLGFTDIYKQLSNDFFEKVSPEEAGSKRMLRINVVVIIGMVFMSVSILGFLISKF